jgi:hypothetical protein
MSAPFGKTETSSPSNSTKSESEPKLHVETHRGCQPGRAHPQTGRVRQRPSRRGPVTRAASGVLIPGGAKAVSGGTKSGRCYAIGYERRSEGPRPCRCDWPSPSRHCRGSRIMSEPAVTAGHAPARTALGVFERFLTVWVCALHYRRHSARAAYTGRVPRPRQRDGRSGQSSGRRAGVAYDRADAAQDRSRRIARSRTALARHRLNGRRQLVYQAALEGAVGVDFCRASLSPVSPCRSDQQLRGRPDSAGCCAMHRYRTWSMASRISR